MALKLSNFMISLTVVLALVTIFMLMLADGAQKYTVSYDNTTFSSFQNKTTALYGITANVSNQSSSITSQNSVFDILGSIFSQGYLTIKSTFLSVDIATDMTSEGVAALNLGPVASVVQTLIVTIISILIFVGIVVALIVKWPT